MNTIESKEAKEAKGSFPICTCSCHVKGMNVLHFIACCSLCYQKYLNEDKSVDVESYDNAVREILSYRKKT